MNLRQRYRFVFLAFALCAMNCGSEATPDTHEVAPTWDNVNAVFQKGCGPNTAGCHTANAYDALPELECRGWVSFVDSPLGANFDSGDGPEPTGCPDRTLYERLSELMSCQCLPDRRIMVPGDPDASYLVDKILGRNLCAGVDGLSAHFPLSDTMPPTGGLTSEDRDLIVAWVAAGAPGPVE